MTYAILFLIGGLIAILVWDFIPKSSRQSKSPNGSKGGDVKIGGKRNFGQGGPGGESSPVGPGGDGGSVSIKGDDNMAVGGEGGSAQSASGKGGAGGRSGFSVMFPHNDKLLPNGHWMSEYGRGGVGPNSQQYNHRIEIISKLNVEYMQANTNHASDYWTNKETIPTDWLNEKLKVLGETWRVGIAENEYDFYDVKTP